MKRDIEFHRQKAREFVSGLSLDEKIKVLYGTFEEKMAMGLPFIDFAGEGAHGVQARHDQSFDFGEPVCTTVFPNPIGMAASFDKKLMHRIGDVVGTEMRSLLNEFKHNGLCALAPTVDMERDPRWGRNEEAYGEDPHLTSRMAGEYILGMSGDDKKYVKCGATLKHFYGNNVECGRYTADSVMPQELREDYYLRVFKEVIEYSQPMSVMTSYNKINGVTATFNPEVKDLLKDKWGVPYIVSDAFTLFFAANEQHTAKDGADAIRKAFDAGVDTFMEDAAFERPAMKEASEKGIVTEEDLNEALISKLTVYSLLGLMKYDLNEDGSSKYFPKKDYNISRVDTPESRKLAREAAAKSVVLLKNDGMLPLNTAANESDQGGTGAGEAFAFGPFVDRCPLDWYSGLPSHKVTFKEGMNIQSATLFPQVRMILEGSGKDAKKYAGLSSGRIVPVDEKDAEVFEIMLWDDTQITIRSISTGKLLTTISPDKKIVNVEDSDEVYTLYANAEDAFSWLVNEAFELIDDEGQVIHFSEEEALNFWENTRICGMKNYNGSISLCFETVKTMDELIDEATEENSLNEESAIIACFGLHPIVSCKEERDRKSIELPYFQRNVLRKLRESFRNITLLLMSNAPIAVEEESEASEIRSILWTAFGSEELGNGLADVITGKVSPSGRLPQTWYRNDSQLGDIEDYDIKSSGMTYLYMTDKPLYRFGYGLTYSDFECRFVSSENEKVAETDDEMSVELAELEISIKNVGSVMSDYVVQIYQSPEGKYYLYGNDRYGLDVKGIQIPVGSRLVAFERIADIKPGEEVSFRVGNS